MARPVARLAAAALLVTGVVNALHYGTLIVLGYPLRLGYPAAYRDLQQAAMWADTWMGIMAIVGAAGLWRGRPWGSLFGIIAAAALIHMGVLDVAFFSQHGMYARLDAPMLEMMIVDAWAFGLGSWVVLVLWREGNGSAPGTTDSA